MNLNSTELTVSTSIFPPPSTDCPSTNSKYLSFYTLFIWLSFSHLYLLSLFLSHDRPAPVSYGQYDTDCDVITWGYLSPKVGLAGEFASWPNYGFPKLPPLPFTTDLHQPVHPLTFFLSFWGQSEGNVFRSYAHVTGGEEDCHRGLRSGVLNEIRAEMSWRHSFLTRNPYFVGPDMDVFFFWKPHLTLLFLKMTCHC